MFSIITTNTNTTTTTTTTTTTSTITTIYPHYVLHGRVSVLDEVKFLDREIFIKGRVPVFLRDQMRKMRISSVEGDDDNDDDEDEEIDWIALAKGRHSARTTYLPTL